MPGAEDGRVRDMETIPVKDPFGVAGDPDTLSFGAALDPIEAQRQLGHFLRLLTGEHGTLHLMAIRVTRYKPGRRCVIEYDVEIEDPDAPPEAVTLLGKVRRLRSGKSGYRLLDALWSAGFETDNRHGISYPNRSASYRSSEVVPARVQGQVADRLLGVPRGEDLDAGSPRRRGDFDRAGVLAKDARRWPTRRASCAKVCRRARSEPRWVVRIEPPTGRLRPPWSRNSEARTLRHPPGLLRRPGDRGRTASMSYRL